MVRWSYRARADLKAIHEFIAKDAPLNAHRVIRDFQQRAASLDHFPHMGRIVPEIADDSIREIPIHSWRQIYQAREGHVYVLTLVHKRRAGVPAEQ